MALELPMYLTNASRSQEGQATTAPNRALTAERLSTEEPRLRRLVHRLLGWPTNRTDVDDVVQETLLAAWRQRRHFRGEANLATWLHAIALNQARRHDRSSRRRRRFFGWLGATAEPTTQPEPSDHETVRTQHALRRLPQEQREVLVLRYLEQQPIPAIATLLGCSRSAVDARLTRARRQLRTLLSSMENA